MSLYNCKLDGEQYRISKFTNDLDVEASYLTDGLNCDCPAGHRPVCRHRIMLPRFIAKSATAGQWFHNYEHQQWVRAASDDEPYTSATLGDLMICDDLASAASELTTSLPDYQFATPELARPFAKNELIDEMILKPINLLELAKPAHSLDLAAISREQEFQLGGFPYECLDFNCTTQNECLLNGCAKGHGRPPRITESKPLRRL